MFKKDKIFYYASLLSGVGIIFAFLGYEFSLLFFIGAYLLRPALYEFGLAKQYADERQLEIHSRSGNLAFMVLMIAIVGLVFWRIADGESIGGLYSLLGLGLAARALTGLVMAGEYRKAGVVIISAVGFYFALFIVIMGGFSVASVFGLILGLIIIGFGQLGRKFPKTISIIMMLMAFSMIYLFDLFQFKRMDMDKWLLFVTPVVTSAVCLFLGSNEEDKIVSSRMRAIVFGTLGLAATTVFTLAIVIGSGNVQEKVISVQLPAGEISEVQGVSCMGRIEYYENGNLMHCSLASEDTLSSQVFAAGTGVHFTEEGVFEWCFLRETTEIQGYMCRGEGHGFITRFHPNGKLRTAWLAEDQTIQGIPCAKFRFLAAVIGWVQGGKNGSTGFHENGELRYCELSKNFTIEGKSFRRGDAIRFGVDGKLVSK